MYNLEQLRMFTETVATGSFSACARKLGKVQSAVSQGVANLEIDLGVVLFDRSSRKPVLTAEGKRLHRYALTILQQADQLSSAARSIDHGEELLIRFAFDSSLLLPELQQLLVKFAERFPNTRIEMLSTANSEIAQLIIQGKADIGLSYCEPDFQHAVEQCFIGNLPFYAVCAPQHPLSQLEQISLNDLLPQRQLSPVGQQGIGLEMIPELSNQIWQTSDFFTLREMLLSGLGWSYIPAHMAQPLIECQQLQRLHPDFDHQPWSPPIERILPKNSNLGPALNWLAEEVKHLLD